MTQLLVWLGPALFLLVGRCNGMRPRPMVIMWSDAMYGLHRGILYRRLELIFSAAVKIWWTTFILNFMYLFVFQTWFVIIQFKTLWCKNLWNVVISGLAFMRVLCYFDRSEFQWFHQDVTRQAVRLLHLKCVIVGLLLRWWLAHLSRINLNSSATIYYC